MDNQNKSSSAGKWVFRILLVLVAIIALMFLGFNYTYNDGKRAGVLIKFSKKGYIFKTYEGELNTGGMGNIPNTAQANEIWYFSVRDQATADSLMNLEGMKVRLHFKQIEKNMPWQGDTRYFVDGVQVITP